MNEPLAKVAMELVRNADKNPDDALGLDSRAISSLCALLDATCNCDEMDDDTYEDVFGHDDPIDAGLTALGILARNNSVASVPSIVDFVNFHVPRNGNSDYLLDSIPDALAAFNTEGATALLEQAVTGSGHEDARCVLIHAVNEWGQRQSSVPPAMNALIASGLADASCNPIRVNTDLMMLVIDLKLDGCAETIERAFSLNQIDCGMAGAWDEVRRMLHVEGLGLPMPEKPFNSMDDFRRNVGIGCFSEDIIFMLGEFQEKEAAKYLDNAARAFERSDEAKGLAKPIQYNGYVHNFLELGLQYLCVTVDTMTVQDARKILLEIYPRKVSMQAEDCREAIDEISAFWKFVDRVHEVAGAKKIGAEVRSLHVDFQREMNDPRNFGPAKSMVMAGKAEGFDMTTQEAIQAFVQVYNSRLPTSRFDSSGSHSVESSVLGMSRKQRKKLLGKKKKKRK